MLLTFPNGKGFSEGPSTELRTAARHPHVASKRGPSSLLLSRIPTKWSRMDVLSKWKARIKSLFWGRLALETLVSRCKGQMLVYLP